jgi:hypothetical protein
MNLFARLFQSRQRGRKVARHATPTLERLEERLQPSISPAGLGAAGQFALLGINGGQVIQNSSSVVGNVGLGPNETSTLQKSTDTGMLVVDPTASTSISSKDFFVSGGIVTQSLSQAASDANAASAADAALTPTQTLGNLTASATITGNGGVNVISLNSLNYNSRTLTLVGGANDVFIFNVAGGFTFAQSNIALSGGVTANHVLFNFPTAGTTIDLYKSANVLAGTFLAPWRSVIYDNPATFNGAIIAQNIDIHSGADLTGATFTLPPRQYLRLRVQRQRQRRPSCRRAADPDRDQRPGPDGHPDDDHGERRFLQFHRAAAGRLHNHADGAPPQLQRAVRHRGDGQQRHRWDDPGWRRPDQQHPPGPREHRHQLRLL